MTDATKRAREYADGLGKGGCLIPKPGRHVPPCHENDFCACDIQAAWKAGVAHSADKLKEAESLASAFAEGSAEWEDEARIAKARVEELERALEKISMYGRVGHMVPSDYREVADEALLPKEKPTGDM